MKARLSWQWMILVVWLLLSAALIASGWNHIRLGVGWDPDDQLRLVQLRDFLHGQGWFDNRQYRLNPPNGAPMHWSRLIELPLAAIVILCAPLFGQATAEIIASAAVPLCVFGIIIYLLARIAAHVGGQVAGVAAAVIAALSAPLVMQLRPMRIDHHGWQIAMAALALACVFHNNARKAGLVMGLALSVWLHISLEGAPMSVAFFLFLGAQWLIHAVESRRLFWTILSFALSSLALFLGTQAQGLGATIYCDTVSPAQVLAILAAAAIMLPAIGMAPRQMLLRAAILLTSGGAAFLVMALRAPACLSGAFGTLDPLVREYWYIYVNEGLPVWRQDLDAAAMLLAGPVVGFASGLYLLLTARGPERSKLVILVFFTAYATLLSFLVFRTVAVASAYTAIPAAVLVARLFARYRQEGIAVRRIAYVAFILLLMVPSAGVNAILDLRPEKKTAQERRTGTSLASCESARSVSALDALPKGQFVVPFDMAPMILARTKHSVLASSHHRNERAMHDHIQIFRSVPDDSHQLMRIRKINYLAVCVDEEELANYKRTDPKGLWALMAKGDVPAWLEPLPVIGKGIRVWRVR